MLRAWLPCTRSRRSAPRRCHRSRRSTPRCSIPHSPTEPRATWVTRWRWCSPRPGRRRSMPPSWSMSTTPSCPWSSTWRRHSPPDAPLQFPELGSNIAASLRATSLTMRVTCRGRGRGARPDREPADRHRADRGQRDPGRPRPAGGAVLTAYVATQQPHLARNLIAKYSGLRAQSGARHRPARRRRLRRQGRASPTSTARSWRLRGAGPSGGLGRDPHREP